MDDDELSELAKQARREERRKWREKNRDHIRQYTREWAKKNPDKIREQNQRYWERKALQMVQGGSVTDNHTEIKQVKEIVTDNVTDIGQGVTDNVTVIVTDNVTDQSPGCIVCGQPIHSRRDGAVYCSASCKQKHYRQKKNDVIGQ